MAENLPPPRFRIQVFNSLDAILLSCEESRRPLQEEPARSELFSLFAEAAARGEVGPEDAPLSADALCVELATRWGLKATVQQTVTQNSGLTAQQMSKMRMLWGLVQMWMEWSYAWERWPDFHSASNQAEEADH